MENSLLRSRERSLTSGVARELATRPTTAAPKAGSAGQQRGLARAATADKRELLAAAYDRVDAPQNIDRAEALMQAGDLHRRPPR